MSSKTKQQTIALLGVILTSTTLLAQMQVGVGRAIITPETHPVWLSGYAARTTPTTGMLHHIWAKALIFEDAEGKRAVIITTDTLGLTREIVDTVTARAQKKHGLQRQELLFNSSHTHSGPVIWPSLAVCCNFTPEQLKQVVQQTQTITDQISVAVEQAVADLAPAKIALGYGEAKFAINRRKREIAPVDHRVTVLHITDPHDKTRVLLYNYACHSTTLVGNNLLINGDHGGFAMLNLEREFPGITAMFVQGCGADINPDPRGKLEHVEAYGKELAEAIKKTIRQPMIPISGSLRTAFCEARLVFKPVDLDLFRQEMVGENKFQQRRAKLMLEAYAFGSPIESIPWPVQGLKIGENFAMLFLSGETVLDYALRARREFSQIELLVAGYCNEVQCYIPSLRILQEGGYEADSSMVYYGQPGPFAEDVEERAFAAIYQVMQALAIKATNAP